MSNKFFRFFGTSFSVTGLRPTKESYFTILISIDRGPFGPQKKAKLDCTYLEFKFWRQFKMDGPKLEIRVLLRHYWKLRYKATAAARKICEVEGEGVVSTRTAQNWFKRFDEGRTSLEDNARSGRPTEIDSDALREAVEANTGVSTRRLSNDLGVSKSSVANHLHRLGKVHRSCRFVPHELTEAPQKNEKTYWTP